MEMSISGSRAAAARSGAIRRSVAVLGAGIGMVVGFSAAYFSTLSIFLKPVAATFVWNRAQTSALAVLAQLGLALGAACVGRLIERHGAHLVVPASVLAFALGLFLLPSVPGNVAVFGVATFFLGLAAVGTTPAGYLTVLPPVFDKRLGLAFGLAMLGLGLGNAVMPVLVQGWIASAGWQNAYRYLSVTVLAGGAVAAALLFGSKVLQPWRNPTQASKVDRPAMQSPAADGHDLATAVREWRFWLIALTLFAVSTAGLGGIVHLVPLLTDRGMSGEYAARMAGLVGLGVLIGRAGTGVLIDVVHARFVAAAAFLAGAAGLLLIAVAPSGSTAAVSAGALLFAFAMGAEGDFVPFFVRRYFGAKHFSQLYGVLFLIFALGGVAGPIVFGIAFDRLGGYLQAYEVAAFACAVSAIAVLALGPYAYAARD